MNLLGGGGVADGSLPPLAHIVAPATLGGIAAYVLAFGSVFVAVHLLRTGRRFRVWAVALLVASSGGLVALQVAASMGRPAAATISVVVPGGGVTTSPVHLSVCGRNGGGGSVAVPGSGTLVALSVDGVQMGEVGVGDAALFMTPGRHTVVAELVTPQHREYSPTIKATVVVNVSGPGALGAAPAC